jgi:hypothetical protein
MRAVLDAPGPVTLVVEDLHWVDEATRELLLLPAWNPPVGVALVLTGPRNIFPCFLPGRVNSPVHPLDLDRRVERLGQRIVETDAGPPNRLPDSQPFLPGRTPPTPGTRQGHRYREREHAVLHLCGIPEGPSGLPGLVV